MKNNVFAFASDGNATASIPPDEDEDGVVGPKVIAGESHTDEILGKLTVWGKERWVDGGDGEGRRGVRSLERVRDEAAMAAA